MKNKCGTLTRINQIDEIITSENSPYHRMTAGWNKIKGVLTGDASEEFDVTEGLRQMKQATSTQSDASLKCAQKIQNIQKRIGFSARDKSQVVFIDLLPLDGGGADLLCQAILNMLSSDNRVSLSDEGKAVSKQEDRSNYKQEEPEALDEQSQEELRNAINDYSSSIPLVPLSIPTIEVSINPSEENRAKILRILGDKLRSADNRDSQETYRIIKLNEQELNELTPIINNEFQQELEVIEQALKREVQKRVEQQIERREQEIERREQEIEEIKKAWEVQKREREHLEQEIEDKLFIMCSQKSRKGLNNEGDTPYHLFVSHVPLARIPVYMKLLDEFDPFVLNNAGKTPYDILTERKCELYKSASTLDESSREGLNALIEAWGKQKIAAEERNSGKEVVAEKLVEVKEGAEEVILSDVPNSLAAQDVDQLIQSFVVLGDQQELPIAGQEETETDMYSID